MTAVSAAFSLGAAILLTACTDGDRAGTPRSPAAAPSPRVVVETRGGRFPVAVEVVRTDEARARGLMFRSALAADAGMLFVFEESGEHAFWMKNTLIPLDMIFIDDDGRIVGIVERAEPHSTRSRSVGAPSRYVLEVNGGWTRARGVAAGDRVRFENVPRF